MAEAIAILGAGARGAEWAARALLLGHPVRVFDPSPTAGIAETLARARAALPALYDVALPPEADFVQTAGIAEAVAGAAFVIDAAPDRIELKRTLFRAALAAMSPGAGLISTARELPLDALRACAPRGGDVHLARADSPAWLLPSLGFAGGPEAEAFLVSLGFDPGPLSADQSPGAAAMAASGGDVAATVATLRALKSARAGCGAAIARHEAALAPDAPVDPATPPVTLDRQVPPDWVDYNGHMNEARYLTAFSDATDRLLLWAGMDGDCVAEGHSVFTVETHIRHLDEVDIGARITVTSRVLDGAGKRLHLWHEMHCDGRLCATGEQLLLHVDLNDRKVALPRADVGRWLSAMGDAQAHLPKPDGFGRHVGAPRNQGG